MCLKFSYLTTSHSVLWLHMSWPTQLTMNSWRAGIVLDILPVTHCWTSCLGPCLAHGRHTGTIFRVIALLGLLRLQNLEIFITSPCLNIRRDCLTLSCTRVWKKFLLENRVLLLKEFESPALEQCFHFIDGADSSIGSDLQVSVNGRARSTGHLLSLCDTLLCHLTYPGSQPLVSVHGL